MNDSPREFPILQRRSDVDNIIEEYFQFEKYFKLHGFLKNISVKVSDLEETLIKYLSQYCRLEFEEISVTTFLNDSSCLYERLQLEITNYRNPKSTFSNYFSLLRNFLVVTYNAFIFSNEKKQLEDSLFIVLTELVRVVFDINLTKDCEFDEDKHAKKKRKVEVRSFGKAFSILENRLGSENFKFYNKWFRKLVKFILFILSMCFYSHDVCKLVESFEKYLKRGFKNYNIQHLIDVVNLNSSYLYFKEKNYDKSIKYMTISNDYKYLGYMYYLKMDNDRSLEELQKVLDYQSINLIADIYYYREDYNSALRWYHKTVNDAKNMRSRLIAMYNISLIYEKLSNYFSQFKVLFSFYQMLVSNRIYNLIPLKQVIYQLAFLALANENYDFSYGAFKKLIDEHRGDMTDKIKMIYKGYIHSMLNLKMYQRVLNFIANISVLYPDDQQLLTYKIDALINTSNIPMVEQVVSLLKDKPDTSLNKSVLVEKYNNIAVTLIMKNKRRKALSYLYKSLKFDIYNTEVNYNLCLMLIDLNFNNEACTRWFSFRNINVIDNSVDELFEKTKIEVMKINRFFNSKDGNVMSKVDEKHCLRLDFLCLNFWKQLTKY